MQTKQVIKEDCNETVDYHETFEETPLWPAILTYLGYAIVILFGHLGDLLRHWGVDPRGKRKDPLEKVTLIVCTYTNIC